MNPTLCSNGAMNGVHGSSPASPAAAEEAALTELARIDLNLVVAFDALAREGNVTRAAERVGVTQSAMSHALRRLRDLLGDPLLVRGQAGMLLTPRAEALRVPLRSGLITLGRALSRPEVFEPESARRAFRLASPDLFDVLVLPRLLERMRQEAPGVDLVIVSTEGRRLADSLETGEVDVAIAPRIDGPDSTIPALRGSSLLRRTLFHDSMVCLLRADHPALARKTARKAPRSKKPPARALPLDTYASLSHVLVSPQGEGPGLADALLARHCLTRRIALRIPHFYTALAIVENSDLVLTAPAGLGRVASERVAVVPLPAELPVPSHAIDQVWHERFSSDAGHTWLRELLLETARAALGHG
jgi:DNA-binding transcriptional LysR family regulator